MTWRFLATIVDTAFKNLRISPLRTALALAGITIGAAAIVSMLQIGLIAERQVLAQLEGAGIHLMVIEPDQETETIALPPEDVDLETVFARRADVEDAAFLKSYSASIVVGGGEAFVDIIEASGAFARLAGLTLQAGTFASLEREAAPIAIGPAIMPICESGDLAIDLSSIVRIGFDGYRIVGQFSESAYHAIIGVDTSQSLIVPRRSLERLTRKVDSWRLILKLGKDVARDRFQQTLIEEFREKYGLGVRAFYAENLIRAEKAQRRSLTFLLAAMGSVSLLVGTVGVTNVMLASVAEHRKEIGLRMAIGAGPTDILPKSNLDDLSPTAEEMLERLEQKQIRW